MYKVYLLKSIKFPKKSYVGVTIKDTKVREKEHNNGLSQSTKAYRPWRLVYFETFYCELCASKREKFLKSGFGFKLRKLILNNI